MKSAERGSDPFAQLALKRARKLKEKGECRERWGWCDQGVPHRCIGKALGHGNNHKCGCGSTNRVKTKGMGRR